VLGVFKRLKNMGKTIGNIIDTVNRVYKQIAPAVDTVLGFVPGGSMISQGLKGASNFIDHSKGFFGNQNRMIEAQPINQGVDSHGHFQEMDSRGQFQTG